MDLFWNLNGRSLHTKENNQSVEEKFRLALPWLLFSSWGMCASNTMCIGLNNTAKSKASLVMSYFFCYISPRRDRTVEGSECLFLLHHECFFIFFLHIKYFCLRKQHAKPIIASTMWGLYMHQIWEIHALGSTAKIPIYMQQKYRQ